MKHLFYKIISLLLFLNVALIHSAVAQTNPGSISTVNVDDLSDDQINQLLQQAKTAGISDAQIIQQAQNRGMPASEAAKLQLRISDLRKKQGTINTDITRGDAGLPGQRQLNYNSAKPDSFLIEKDIFESIQPVIFGADLFKNNQLTFEPDLKLATPVNYIVGPNDELNINVYGKSLVNWKLNVSPEGTINIPGAGILNVGGKTIEQATTAIKNKLLANNYAIGNGTNVQVTLGNIRSIKVIMVGQLNKPGTYTLPSLATVFNALYAAGGPNNKGSFRQIEIIRNNNIVRRMDVYDFLVEGNQENNIALQDQDIIRVPTYRTRVQLAGQVKIPALFEVLPGESLQDVLNFAGGFTDSAYTARIKVSQINDQQRRLTDVVEEDFKSYIPLRGDKFLVESILNRYQNRVFINGAVFRPGAYELQKGLTVNQLIANASGLKEDAFTERAIITRLLPDNTTQILSFNVKDVINNTVTIPLQREDVVSVSSIFDLRDTYQVTINGSIRKPGIFVYDVNMKLEDLVLKAGGFAEGASTNRIEVARRINNGDPASNTGTVAKVFSINVNRNLNTADGNFILMPFDVVSVYAMPGYETQKTVQVEGEVLYPGQYTIEKKDEKISSIIARAGGITAAADVSGGTLKRSNIAILGIDKDKADTNAITQERNDRINRLKQTFHDSSLITNEQLRNNYIGIDLEDILKNQNRKTDLLLEDGDVIRIPKQQQTVRVNGEVLFPSVVVYEGTKSFKQYIYNAGGFSPNALKKGAYVVYPNGTVKSTHKFLFFNSHPKVKAGSELYVPKKPERIRNTAQQILGVTTGLASLGAIILGILSLN